MRILVFGDSVVLGTWDSLGGWVDRVKQHYHELYVGSDGDEKVQVYNLGIGGEASERLLKRLQNEIKARWDDRWPTAIIIATGTNDARLLGGKQLQATEEEFRENLAQIFTISKQYTPLVLYISPNGFESDEVTFKGHIFSNNRLKNYVQMAREVTAEMQIPMLNIFEAIKNKPEYFGVDGVHPNSAGYEKLANIIQPEIENLLSKASIVKA